jgi:DnaK suppressor protein
MNAQELETYKNSLMKQREQLVGQINENTSQTFGFDLDNKQDPVDVAVTDREQTIMLSITETERDLLGQIDEALARIELGTYGVCQNCGKEIAAARLAAVSYAAFCMDCQQKLERGELDEEM